ncbi:hypothetical protein N7451_008692 [Penicillium sp. IBT 35674x]|nr:hypothetical protein N7451_008692 [Penicillium sp. IBT 35674x]
MASGSLLQDPSLQARLHQSITLIDGRTLGFAEFGSTSENATPLFAFHGLPGSRFESASFHHAAREVNVRVIGIDRPGLGLSSPQPNRKLMNWPADTRELAKNLNLAQYYVLGVSAGGPYALACAHGLPESELLGVGVMSGMGPWQLGTGGATLDLRLLLNCLAYAPWLARIMLNTIFGEMVKGSDPVKMREVVIGATKRMKPADRDFCETPESLDLLQASLKESFRHGVDATVDEGRVLTSDWGFELDQIHLKNIRLWYGTEDYNTPVILGRYMAERIPHAVLKEYTGDSHFTIHRRATEILRDLVAPG